MSFGDWGEWLNPFTPKLKEQGLKEAGQSMREQTSSQTRDMFPEPITKASATEPEEPASLGMRVFNIAQRAWRPAGTCVAVLLALLLMGHVVNGKNGLTVWHGKRAEDKQLQKDIGDLQAQNAALRAHVDRLKSDPDAIEHEAREKLHYAKPNEIIVALPSMQPSGSQAEPAGNGR